MKPKVSIVIPTYRRPDTLDRAVNSALGQTYPNIEVIVVDDNNPETEGRLLTEEKMSEFSTDSRVRYIQHEHNKNGSAARNTGVYASQGDYVAFLDDDDEYLPRKIESQLKALEGRGCEWACCYSKFAIRQSGKRLFESDEHREGNLYLEALTREFHIASGSNLLVRRSAFIDINGFDESFIRNQDIELLTRLLHYYKIAYSDYCGLIVNVHNNHSCFDEQVIINQYVERFEPYVEALPTEEKKRFYKCINQQRFFDLLRAKHDYRGCMGMLKNKEISLVDASSYTIQRFVSHLKRSLFFF